MLENREKFLTPIRIEFNIGILTGEFHVINESKNLFEQMSSGDPYIRVPTGNQKGLL